MAPQHRTAGPIDRPHALLDCLVSRNIVAPCAPKIPRGAHRVNPGFIQAALRPPRRGRPGRHGEGPAYNGSRETVMRIGVLLGGCGLYDGSDVIETVLVLQALDAAGERPLLLAPDRTQTRTIDHRTGEVMPGVQRNVLCE